MAKRIKRAEKSAKSIKEQIEEHFIKLEKDIQESRIDRGRYHAREIDKSLLKALEIKIGILGTNDNSVQVYRDRLNELKKKLGEE